MLGVGVGVGKVIGDTSPHSLTHGCCTARRLHRRRTVHSPISLITLLGFMYARLPGYSVVDVVVIKTPSGWSLVGQIVFPNIASCCFSV